MVETALDHGITLVDTAEAYGIGQVVDDAIDRSGVGRGEPVASTEFSLRDGDGDLRPPEAVGERLRGSLERPGTDCVGVYHLHGMRSGTGDCAVRRLDPAAGAGTAHEAGTVRLAGITGSVSADPGHDALSRAAADGGWDVVMVGDDPVDHAAGERVLEPAAHDGIGTIGMVPAWRALSGSESSGRPWRN
jgi:aryl-alcohol dehydrogenase-like predicted oxidoreductase